MRFLRALSMACLIAPSALASSTFPGVVKDEFQLLSPPPCTLCHETDRGGAHTVDKPFGYTMLDFGVTGGNVGALQAALRRDNAEGTDSDGDGMHDYDELRAGKNPNVPQAADGGLLSLPERAPPLGTGCNFRGSPERPSPPFGAALLLGVLAVSRRASTRARQRSIARSSRMRRASPSSNSRTTEE